jgi:hypothetical protein
MLRARRYTLMGEHFNRNDAVYVSVPREPIVGVESVRRWRGSKLTRTPFTADSVVV